MSEIPFVNQLGDAIEEAIAHRASARRRLVGRRRWRLIVVLAMLLLGGAAGARTLFFSSTQAAAIYGIGCYDGTGPDASGSFDVYGPSAVAACRGVYRHEGSRLGRPGAKLVACVGGPGPIAMVFEARGAGQCQRLGFAPLSHGYAAAVAKVYRLDTALLALVRSRACVPPLELAGRVDRVLAELDWVGWRAVVRWDVSPRGPCGDLGYDSSGEPAVRGSLDVAHDTVLVFTGPAPGPGGRSGRALPRHPRAGR
jgi:hypothetical protein